MEKNANDGLLNDLRSAIEYGKDVDYMYDGENEIAVDTFSTDEALEKVVEVLQKYGFIKKQTQSITN